MYGKVSTKMSASYKAKATRKATSKATRDISEIDQSTFKSPIRPNGVGPRQTGRSPTGPMVTPMVEHLLFRPVNTYPHAVADP